MNFDAYDVADHLYQTYLLSQLLLSLAGIIAFSIHQLWPDTTIFPYAQLEEVDE